MIYTLGEPGRTAAPGSGNQPQRLYIGSILRLIDLLWLAMQRRKAKPRIELGMKVSVRRSSQNHIGVVTRIEGDYVFVRWTSSDRGETAEYQAHRDDVTPLAGWL